MSQLSLSPLDHLVFWLLFMLTFTVVVWSHRRQARRGSANELLDYFLMGRQLSLPFFIGTLVATWYGGIFGVTKIAFESGIFNFITQGVFWYLTYIVFAFVLVDKIHRFQVMTLPELCGQMFGPKAARLSAWFNLFNVLPVTYVISLGLLLQAFWGGPLLLWLVLGALMAAIYALFSGFRGVVLSDLVQFFIMCSSVVLVVVFAMLSLGGLDDLRTHLPETHFSLTGGQSWAATLVWGLIALSTLVDPSFYQRCLAAKTPQVARRGILWATLIWMVFDLCTTLGAMYARAALPEASSDTAYLEYALTLLPEGLRGFFLAGIAATILSTLDSYLLIAGATLSYDLLDKTKATVARTRWGVVGAASLATLLAWSFEGNIREVWKTLGTYSAACLLLPVMMGYISPGRISDRQFCGACLGSVVTTTVWRYTERTGFWSQVDEIYIGVLTTALLIVWGWCRTSSKSRGGV